MTLVGVCCMSIIYMPSTFSLLVSLHVSFLVHTTFSNSLGICPGTNMRCLPLALLLSLGLGSLSEPGAPLFNWVGWLGSFSGILVSLSLPHDWGYRSSLTMTEFFQACLRAEFRLRVCMARMTSVVILRHSWLTHSFS